VSPEGNELLIRIDYTLLRTLAARSLEVLVA
jgi:hypothetical protein